MYAVSGQKLSKKAHINGIKDAGDFCFVSDTDGQKRVVMACPLCSGEFVCPHQVVQEDPLTLSPSVVGPERAWNWREQILAPCGHHFWVRDGEVVDAM